MKRNTLALRKDPAILRGQLRAWLDLDDLTERSRPPELQSQALLSLLARMVIGRLMAAKYFNAKAESLVDDGAVIVRNLIGKFNHFGPRELSPAERLIIRDGLDCVDEMILSTTPSERRSIASLSQQAMLREYQLLQPNL